jgi:radical SAM superfamily enzyme YgiQ (UPF0313 family)
MSGRVLFVNPDLHQEDNHFPLGYGYMAAMLRQDGANVSTFCMDVFHYTNEQLANYLDWLRGFDLICVGFLAARFKETIEELLKVIDAHKNNAWLVIGGPGPSPISEWMLNNTPADVVCIGESEDTIVELLRCKVEGGTPAEVSGVAFDDGEFVYGSERTKPIRDLDSIPFPAWDLFPMDRYTTCLKLWGMEPGDRTFGMITSRGCTDRCSFCYRMESGIRFRSVENVIEEIGILKEKYGVTGYFMHDELFAASKSRVFEFCDALQELGIKFSASARVDKFDEEMARSLQDSGCTFVNIGFESSSQDVLDRMNKRTTVDMNVRAAEICREIGIGFGLNFLWGLPGDTPESLFHNVAFIKKYNTYDQLRTIRPATPFPGSPLYYQAIDEGLLEGPGDFFDKFRNSDLITVNFLDGIPDDEAYKLIFNANRDLIRDHHKHTTMPVAESERLIEDFRRVYFGKDASFRGARHYEAET